MKTILILSLTFLSTFSFAKSGSTKENCIEKIKAAAVSKHLGTSPKGEYKVLAVNHLGAANKKLGNLKLHLYTVEVSDEADGALMVVFVIPQKCEIHETVFGTHAMDR